MKQKVRITKVTDNKFNGKHPHAIDVGYTKTGYSHVDPEVGERFNIFDENENLILTTSPVVDMITDELIMTLNSKYKIEYLDE